jgi:hypothetical protein
MILACEPICIGFEHSMVNAAMLAVVKDAFPGEELLFAAEEGHLRLVEHDPGIVSREGMTFQALPLPLRKASSAERFDSGLRMVRELFFSAEHKKASLVVFTCIDGETLHAIKMLLGESPGFQCVVVLHGILSSVGRRPSLLPWKNRHLFRNWLLRENPERLAYIVLGESIERELAARFPALRPHLISIDLPYRFAAPEEYVPFPDRTVSFGSLGVLRKVKGSHLFLRLAGEVASARTAYRPRFVCVGPIVDKKLRRLLSSAVSIPSPDTPLPLETYAALTRKLDYAVLLHGAETALQGSGVLFDAFSYLKPVIALKSPYFTSYFEKMGNIGYLCDHYADLKRRVFDLLDHPPVDEYLLQRQALLTGREQLQVPVLAETLQRKLGAGTDSRAGDQVAIMPPEGST